MAVPEHRVTEAAVDVPPAAADTSGEAEVVDIPAAEEAVIPAAVEDTPAEADITKEFSASTTRFYEVVGAVTEAKKGVPSGHAFFLISLTVGTATSVVWWSEVPPSSASVRSPRELRRTHGLAYAGLSG